MNLGRGKRGSAIRKSPNRLERVARLQCESEITVELLIVSSILDCEPGCAIKRASDKDTG